MSLVDQLMTIHELYVQILYKHTATIHTLRLYLQPSMHTCRASTCTFIIMKRSIQIEGDDDDEQMI